MSFPRFSILFALLITIGLLQGAPQLSWLGIRPNLMLAFLAVLALMMPDFILYLGFVLIGAALVGPTSGFFMEKIAFIAIPLIFFAVRNRIPFRPITNALLLGGAATLAFYLAVDAEFIAFDFVAVFFEMIYNALLAAVFYLSFQRIFSYGKTSAAFL